MILLRHGAANLLVRAVFHPRIAEDLPLRHASSMTTMKIYSHVSGGESR
jgi:hypothetical protein